MIPSTVLQRSAGTPSGAAGSLGDKGDTNQSDTVQVCLASTLCSHTYIKPALNTHSPRQPSAAWEFYFEHKVPPAPGSA